MVLWAIHRSDIFAYASPPAGPGPRNLPNPHPPIVINCQDLPGNPPPSTLHLKANFVTQGKMEMPFHQPTAWQQHNLFKLKVGEGLLPILLDPPKNFISSGLINFGSLTTLHWPPIICLQVGGAIGWSQRIPLPVQTFPDTTPPRDKNHPFIKIIVNVELMNKFWYPLSFRRP